MLILGSTSSSLFKNIIPNQPVKSEKISSSILITFITQSDMGMKDPEVKILLLPPRPGSCDPWLEMQQQVWAVLRKGGCHSQGGDHLHIAMPVPSQVSV